MKSNGLGLAVLAGVALLSLTVVGLSFNSAATNPVPAVDSVSQGPRTNSKPGTAQGSDTVKMSTWEETRKISAVRR